MSSVSTRTWESVLAEHRRVFQGLEAAGPVLNSIAAAIITAFRAGHRLYIVGNGGSAADAQHIAGELLGRFKRDRPPLPAVALTTDTSTMTAVANDYDYDRVFARQVEGLITPGDVLWCLSTSGNSPSILAAAKAAREKSATVVGFTGESGGKLLELCDLAFKVPDGSSDRIQEGHLVGYHFLCEQIEAAFA